MKRLFAALLCAVSLTAFAQQPPAADSSLRARELKVLRDGETSFLQTLSEFNKLLSENPARGTSARTRLEQMAVQLNDSAGELRSRFDYASRNPQNRDELAKLKRPWEAFLNQQSPMVRDLIRDGKKIARPVAPLPGGPARPAAEPHADFDLAALSRDTGVPLGPPVSRSSPDALPIPPRPGTGAPPPPPSPDTRSATNVYFVVLSQAYRTYDDEWKLGECRYRVVQKTRTNYGSRSEAEDDAARMRSQGYADAETRYFDTWQTMDAFMRDWEKRRVSDSRFCRDAYVQARERAGAPRK